MGESPITPASKRSLKIVGVVFVLAVLVLIIRQLAADWDAVQNYPWTVRPGWLVLSMLATQVAYLTMARAWRSVLRAIQIRIPLRRAYWMFYISNLGRYIPGKLWQIGAAAVIGRQVGLSGTDMAASMIVHLLYFLPVGATLALASGGLPAPYNAPQTEMLAWLVAGAALVVALWPHLLLKVAPPLARWLKLDPARWRLQLSRRLGIILQTAVAWLCLAAGFALLAYAVMPLDRVDFIGLSRVYIAAHIIGYLVLIAPAGLGIREGVMVVLLQSQLGAGPAAGLALLSRIWFTVAELGAVSVAAFLLKQDRATGYQVEQEVGADSK
jgi:uncharacterized membrane protein YbhN (UPF0104 family)